MPANSKLNYSILIGINKLRLAQEIDAFIKGKYIVWQSNIWVDSKSGKNEYVKEIMWSEITEQGEN